MSLLRTYRIVSFCKSTRITTQSCPNVFRCFSSSQGLQDDIKVSQDAKETIGFIGLGNMGSQMSMNLLKKGYNLVVFDVYPESMESLKAHGALVATSPYDVAQKTKKIITMLPSSPDVKEVYAGKSGILSGAQNGSIFIDSSTIDPSVSKDMLKFAMSINCSYVDAPVSGGVNAAKEGTLTIMVGGSAEDFIVVEKLLSSMAKNVVHCGSIGTGQAAKICNNMLLAISMIGTAEVMNLGTRLGLDKKMLARIINMSSGRCWSSEMYNPCPGVMESVPSSNNYQRGFGVQLMAKDLGLAQNAATSTRSATPLGSLAHQTYRVMCNRGYAKLDFSSVYKFLREDD
uniref:3-hydroxyisobutyrate dehydrogenase n=1 Tax=Hydra vulgaris TaxID=6087 RepID=T2MFU1_HYDVU